MIRLSIRDFQAIDQADLEIEGLTVVLGPTNSGKSSLVRAFLSAITNQPPPGYVRRGADKARVEIDLGDGEAIVWEKGAGHSLYRVGDQVYEKTARSVPDAIRAKGLRPLVVGDASYDVQVASQHSPLFLLGKGSGSALSTVTSSLSGLDPVVRAVKLVAHDRQEAQRGAVASRGEVTTLEAHLAPLQDLDDVFPFVEDTQRILSGMDPLLQLLDWLEASAQTRFDSVREIRRGEAATLVSAPDVSDVAALLVESTWVADRLPRLDDALRDVGLASARGVELPNPEAAIDLVDQVRLVDSWLPDLLASSRVADLFGSATSVVVPDGGDVYLFVKEAAWLSSASAALDAALREVRLALCDDVLLPTCDLSEEGDLVEIDDWLRLMAGLSSEERTATHQVQTLSAGLHLRQAEIDEIVGRFPECPFCGTVGVGRG